jgi:hypothetical protein
MSAFPTTAPTQDGYELTPEWKTIIREMDSGAEQRRQKWIFPKFNVSLTFSILTQTEIDTLWNFYMARHGAAEAFYFYTIESGDWDGLYVGVGDGATKTFDLPGKSTSAQTIYVDGISTSAVTILTGGGSESSDRVTFTTEPAAGAILSCDFTGYLRIRCRFEEDKMSKRIFTDAIFRTGLKLKGLHG